MNTQRPETHQNQDKHILWGLMNFSRYNHPDATRISPSDGDDLHYAPGGEQGETYRGSVGAIYDARANARKQVGPRRLLVEFKSFREDPSLRGERDDRRSPLYQLMGGQLEMLESFSRVPNQQALIAWDPYVDDCSDERMDSAVPLNLNIIRNGNISKVFRTNIGRYSKLLWDWQWNAGPLRQPYFDHEEVLRAEIAKAVAAGKKLEELDIAEIVKTLRLPTFR